MTDTTIAAISTGLTDSGIGIVRVSGSEALLIVDKIFKGKNNKKLIDQDTYTAHYGKIYDGDVLIDEVVVLIMKAPHSFTCEDTVEINCHGGMLVTRKILETVIKYGANVAEPGEFTKRAFLNGRIDLSQAESVIDIINSKNDFALNNSLSILNGKLFEKIEGCRNVIIHETAFIESAIDDPEHYSLDGYSNTLFDIVNKLKVDVENMLKTFDTGKILKEGINTVIVGKPNAGKSTLLNSLIGEDKAIVTSVPGTTRDVIEEYINLEGITIKLIDTAGIRNTEDIVESIGVKKSLEFINKADLVLYVVDSSIPLDQNDLDIIEKIIGKKVIVLLNKSDLEKDVDDSVLEKHFNNIICTSAKNDTDLLELKQIIKELFFNGEVSFNDEICITNVRHKKLLLETCDSLNLVLEGIEMGVSEDLFIIDLMNAYRSLGLIIGKMVDDDLVNEIFSKFCMGK